MPPGETVSAVSFRGDPKKKISDAEGNGGGRIAHKQRLDWCVRTRIMYHFEHLLEEFQLSALNVTGLVRILFLRVFLVLTV